jgi:hypothetical protein
MFKLFRITLVEILLLQTAVWLLLWLTNEWLTRFLSISIGAVVFVVLVISAVAEKIERSRVPFSYFRVMIVSLISIFFAWGIYRLISASSF